MNRTLFIVAACALIALIWALAGNSSSAQGERGGKQKVILLGFDGADSELARRWMESGDLPNLKHLAESGTFSPLGTSNPAQSSVAWAVVDTASNPGKTNIPDFVRRALNPPRSLPSPELAGTKKEIVTAAEFAAASPALGARDKAMLALADETTALWSTIGFGVAVFLVVTSIFRVAFRVRSWLAALVGLLFAGGGVFAFDRLVKDVPKYYALFRSEMEGERFWDVLGRQGVRFTGLQVPVAFPCVAEDNVKLQGGLFTPDVRGGTGAWYVFTNDEWELNALSTDSGGTVYKFGPPQEGVLTVDVPGPENHLVAEDYRRRITALDERINEPGLQDAERARLMGQQESLKTEQSQWTRVNRNVTVPLKVEPDYAAHTARITLGDTTQEIPDKGWSDYFRITFELSRLARVPAIARVYVMQCGMVDGQERIELFVPPISVSPEDPPVDMPMSWPRGFSAELAGDVGLYDTIGWACYSNALKDQELPEQAFMEGLEFVMAWRTRLFQRELARDDWDVLFHLESVVDRCAHMMYRFFDPEHPQYDSRDRDGNLMRDIDLKAYGRTFPMKDAIKETYREMDRLVGDVVRRIEAGEFGRDVTLMIISDHGFQSFRYGFDVNAWLYKNGYLALKAGKDAATLEASFLNDYVDWDNTRAYSMSLGKIYLNLAGREGKGIVTPEARDALVEEIIAKLEAQTDSRDGGSLVRRAYDAKDIYSGRYWDEPGDIILGLEAGYRVDWKTTLGGMDGETIATDGIVQNRMPWSGDHCGVDPDLVQGIFFCNRPVKLDATPDLLNVAPTICALFGVELPATWDGKPLAIGP